MQRRFSEKVLVSDIHDSEEKRRLIMNAALDAIICIDVKGCITFWNPQAEKIFGWKDSEVNGHLLSEIIIPESFRSMHAKGMASYLKTGHGPALNVLLELSAIDRSGKEFPIELTILPIKQAKEEFFCAFIRDITARKKAEVELNEKNSELQKLSAHLQQIREEERKYLAREVHDELGQLVSALKIDIDWINIKIELDEAAKKRMDHAIMTIEVLISSIRKIASSLRPSILDDFGLNVAIEWQCRDIQNANEIICVFTSELDEKELPVKIKTELFRMVQESLTNVMLHSEAKKVSVEIKDDEAYIYIKIEDDGKGFDPTVKKNTVGLIGLRERAASLNGRFNIQSEIGKGTVVLAIIPKK
jgi:PAS domain S-box-containing protein